MPGRSRRPRREASTETTGRGGWIASSGTNTTSPLWPPVASQRRAASMASRVLPTPPGPVRLISRDRVNSPDSSASSRSRPTKLDCAIGSRPGLSSAGSGPRSGSRPRPGSRSPGGSRQVAAASSSAMAGRARADGRDRPDSHRFTVANDTPSRRASCSWLNPSRVRSSRSRATSGTASSGSLFTQAAYGLHAVAQCRETTKIRSAGRTRRRWSRYRPSSRSSPTAGKPTSPPSPGSVEAHADAAGPRPQDPAGGVSGVLRRCRGVPWQRRTVTGERSSPAVSWLWCSCAAGAVKDLHVHLHMRFRDQRGESRHTSS